MKNKEKEFTNQDAYKVAEDIGYNKALDEVEKEMKEHLVDRWINIINRNDGKTAYSIIERVIKELRKK